ncbi:unnamed protein product [Mytilus edulis]|uniref:Chromo domain-containing protein n=1 Tax=Mytilus edulis TaxID=6550 RepID=A0A8S3S769_MYTED|nr:unnamed protein product [Mytilus edulis]
MKIPRVSCTVSTAPASVVSDSSSSESDNSTTFSTVWTATPVVLESSGIVQSSISPNIVVSTHMASAPMPLLPLSGTIFLVKWKGYQLADCTWEPITHIPKPDLELFLKPEVCAGKLSAYANILQEAVQNRLSSTNSKISISFPTDVYRYVFGADANNSLLCLEDFSKLSLVVTGILNLTATVKFENEGKKFDEIHQRQQFRKLKTFTTFSEQALAFAESFGLKPLKIDLKSDKGKFVSVVLGEDTAEKENKTTYANLNSEDKDLLKQVVFYLITFA